MKKTHKFVTAESARVWSVLVSILAVGGAIYFLTLIDYEGVTFGRIHYVPGMLSLLLNLTGVTLLGFGWIQLVHVAQPNISVHWRKLIPIFSASWLARYVPGKVFAIANRIIAPQRHGFKLKSLGRAAALEAGWQFFLNLVLGTGLVALSGRIPLKTIDHGLVAGILAVSVAIVLASLATRKIRSIRTRLKSLTRLSWSANSLGFFVTGILAIAGSTVLTALAVDIKLDVSLALLVTGASLLAGALGMLAVFLPAGIGAREGVFFVLVLGSLSNDESVTLLIASRIISVVADLGFGALGFVLHLRSRRDSHLSKAK